MKFLLTYLRNLALITLVIGGALLFAKNLFPTTLPVFSLLSRTYHGLNLWPIIIIFWMIVALPRGKR
jgi:hypothetical protein